MKNLHYATILSLLTLPLLATHQQPDGVTIRVVDNKGAIVSFNLPANTTFATLARRVSDDHGVRNVEFYIDGQRVMNDQTVGNYAAKHHEKPIMMKSSSGGLKAAMAAPMAPAVAAPAVAASAPKMAAPMAPATRDAMSAKKAAAPAAKYKMTREEKRQQRELKRAERHHERMPKTKHASKYVPHYPTK
jgi:hypothetical protein